MPNINNIFIILKKELRNFFNNPTAYIVMIVFLLLWEFLFFRTVFLEGQSSLRTLFSFLPWLLLFVLPAMTMSSFSQEKNDGTLEFLLTQPLKDSELLLGKFFASLSFYFLTLIFIIPTALSLNMFGGLDWGIVLGQFLGSLAMGSVIIALGIFISSLFKEQIISLLISAAITFGLVIISSDLVTATIPSFLNPIFEGLGLSGHFNSMSRGVIDIKDVWYFISATLVFLAATYLSLLSRRWGNKKSVYAKFRLVTIIFIIVAILSNIAGYFIAGRIDLTAGQFYTFSSGSKNIIGNLKDEVNLTFYVSDNLPSWLLPTYRDINDILKDYQTYGKGKIKVNTKNPLSDEKIAKEAQDKGINPVQFNAVNQGSFEAKKGYIGLLITRGDKNEVIPIIENTSDIEYQITSLIKKITTDEKKKIVFVSGHGERNISSDYPYLVDELKKQYDVTEFNINEKNLTLPDKTAALVIAGPTQKIDDKAQEKIKEYLNNGGSAFVMIDTLSPNPNSGQVTKNENSAKDLLKDYGVEVNTDLVYDLRSNETVQIGQIYLPYPFWPKAIANPSSNITAKLENLSLAWPSSINIDENKVKEKGLKTELLFTTTKTAGHQTSDYSIDLEKGLSTSNLSTQTLAISLTGQNSQDKKPRIVLVGNSAFLMDQFCKAAAGNLSFALQSISWLSQEESLASIKMKASKERPLVFSEKNQPDMIQYGNLAFVFFVPAIFGAIRILRRRRLKKYTYSNRD